MSERHAPFSDWHYDKENKRMTREMNKSLLDDELHRKIYAGNSVVGLADEVAEIAGWIPRRDHYMGLLLYFISGLVLGAAFTGVMAWIGAGGGGG